jgi:parvulin-like peptidyl-prolyl isomerase
MLKMKIKTSRHPQANSANVVTALYCQVTSSMTNHTLDVDVNPEDIVSALKQTFQYKTVHQQVLHHRMVRQVAADRGLMVSPEEIQLAADQERREKQLERAADTLAWLMGQHVTADEWEDSLSDRLLADKLAHSLFAAQIEQFFAEHRLDYDQVVLYQIIVPYEQVAQELFYQIEESEISFYEAAHLYDIEPQRRWHCGYEGTLYRWNLPPEIAAAVFAAAPCRVIRPLPVEQGYSLLMVDEFRLAELTAELRQEIMNRLFQDWLSNELQYRISNQ